MTVGEDTNRWFVTTSGNDTEDVGADSLKVEMGSLVFYSRYDIVTFAYAPGTWKFVEFQE